MFGFTYRSTMKQILSSCHSVCLPLVSVFPPSSLIAIMRKSSKGSKASVKVEQPPGEAQQTSIFFVLLLLGDNSHSNTLQHLPLSHPSAAEGVDDVKVKAVNEMMERIKLGVVLRPVKSHESKVSCRGRRRGRRRKSICEIQAMI